MTESQTLITAIRDGLASSGDAGKAPDMQRYMKSTMPFHGVPSPERTTLARRLFSTHVLTDEDEWRAAVLTLWREATHREERYMAIALTGDRRYAAWQTPALLPLYEELIVTGAWWDYVDEVASRRVGPLLRRFPDDLTPAMYSWATDTDLWKRRTSIICQLTFKEATDTKLLTSAIEANLDDRDFFIRKGIGWALRQFARTEPGWVRAFVDTHPGLSPLSVREAVKHL
ncbi:DNA alkylation repair protein [Actinophytocola oryzae]|uniref:3-methyladenine DNA glycosylase AlkD n=1 Tax=Actinophytocola oryzae TaxID=502181 RepID=A0A4R7V478_9PSEU|nr:DNA alkylation repair protein [Actinophytocola oryzae]TDV42725.1 3-methyladenine DNA glycosylase AlkD [Actinophytocola oryzae]